MEIHHILKKPIITEKSENLQKQNKYVFEVDRRSSKFQIKKAVEQVFGVNVEDVNTAMIHGKSYRFGQRRNKIGKRGDWKKAVVTIKEGQKIEWTDSKSRKEE